MERVRKNTKPMFEVAERGFEARAWYLEDTEESKGDALVVITQGGQPVRAFLYPAYKIWNIAAHFSDIVDGELTEDNTLPGYQVASGTGLGVVLMPFEDEKLSREKSRGKATGGRLWLFDLTGNM